MNCTKCKNEVSKVLYGVKAGSTIVLENTIYFNAVDSELLMCRKCQIYYFPMEKKGNWIKIEPPKKEHNEKNMNEGTEK